MNHAQNEFYQTREMYEKILDSCTPNSVAYNKWVAFIKGTGLQILRSKSTGKHKIVPPAKK